MKANMNTTSEPIVKHCVVYLKILTAFLSISKLLTWDTRFTYYKVLTFSCTNFKILNTVLHTTDLMMHDFELHEFFYSPKNVLLKAWLSQKATMKKKIFFWIFLQSIYQVDMKNVVKCSRNQQCYVKNKLFVMLKIYVFNETSYW